MSAEALARIENDVKAVRRLVEVTVNSLEAKLAVAHARIATLEAIVRVRVEESFDTTLNLSSTPVYEETVVDEDETKSPTKISRLLSSENTR